MREVVDGELRFVPVFCARVGTYHYCGVVDHDVYILDLLVLEDLFRGFSHAGEGIEVYGYEFCERGRGDGLDGVDGRLGF